MFVLAFLGAAAVQALLSVSAFLCLVIPLFEGVGRATKPTAPFVIGFIVAVVPGSLSITAGVYVWRRLKTDPDPAIAKSLGLGVAVAGGIGLATCLFFWGVFALLGLAMN